MKLTKTTLDILKNFSTIYKSIVVRKGSTLRTINANDQTIFAEATVEEKFPKDFCIYDLSRFLAVADLMKDAEFTFNDDSVLITSHNRQVSYYYASIATIPVDASKRELDIPATPIVFTLPQVDLKALQQMSTILRLDEVAVVGAEGKNITVNIVGTTDDTFSLDTGTPSPGRFKAIFRIENLRLIPGDYECRISPEGIGYFKNSFSPVHYWIAAEEDTFFSDDITAEETNNKTVATEAATV